MIGGKVENKSKSQKEQKKEKLGFEREKQKRKIRELSWGMVRTLTDLVFLQLCLASSLTFSGRQAQKGIKEIFEQYQEIDWEKIRRVAGNLKKRGLVNYTKGKLLEPRITKTGLKKFNSLVPFYHKKRTWDKKIYLITYDIPEEKRNERNRLRFFLEKIGCGMMQASVWLTCFNPKKLVKNFVEENNISGSVVVADIGKDGSVGEEDLKDLVGKVYRLEELNDRYREFIWGVKRGEIKRLQVDFAYLSILADDSQVPFELLPDDWAGEEAHKIFKKLSD